MPQLSRSSLRKSLSENAETKDCVLSSVQATLPWRDVLRGSCLNGQTEQLRGRSVLIATRDQFTAALALIELDGVARRLLACPADLNPKHLPFIIDTAELDAVVCDGSVPVPDHPAVRIRLACSSNIVETNEPPQHSHRTEWVLLTSGTTGVPKLVLHTLDSLASAIGARAASSDSIVWSTFYDIRRYGGLQIFLRAVLTGTSLVLSDEHESPSEFLERAGTRGVTHISGTPSHWRRALMSPSAQVLEPRYVRLSGEIADQAILSHLRSVYPQAAIGHAFASTEAGVAFDVNDGQVGFPETLIGQKSPVELKVEDGSLRIRSDRVADRYLGETSRPLRGEDGFVDTGDMVSLQDGRYYFAGRRDGTINVGGLKVHPEEVEAVINRHPVVQMALVRTRKNSITGALVVADVVLKSDPPPPIERAQELQQDIQRLCREALPEHKVPAIINIVAALAVAETGKLLRQCVT